MRRLDRTLAAQLVTFAGIGVASTLAYAALYVGLRTATGPQAANAIALVVTAIGNTFANRRLTFGVRGRSGAGADLLVGLVAFALALLMTTAAVTVLGLVAPTAPRWLEVAVLTLANVAATVSRFVLLRAWLGGRRVTAPVATRDLAPESIRR